MLALLCLLRAPQLFVLMGGSPRSDLINEACEWGHPQFLTR